MIWKFIVSKAKYGIMLGSFVNLYFNPNPAIYWVLVAIFLQLEEIRLTNNK